MAAGVALAAAAGCRREAPSRPEPPPPAAGGTREEAPRAQSAGDVAAWDAAGEDAASATGQTAQAAFYRSDPPAEVEGTGWLERETRKGELIRSLREYAARAGPDDPFALSEERIKALETQDGLVIQ
jgi:hypothetical protein